ncbi:hypothetical protein D3C81_1414290 [compost metagenome]
MCVVPRIEVGTHRYFTELIHHVEHATRGQVVCATAPRSCGWAVSHRIVRHLLKTNIGLIEHMWVGMVVDVCSDLPREASHELLITGTDVRTCDIFSHAITRCSSRSEAFDGRVEVTVVRTRPKLFLEFTGLPLGLITDKTSP